MIATLRGTVLESDGVRTVVEAGGVGYEVLVTAHSAARLAPGAEAFLHVIESAALYGGTTTLYGFLSREEKDLFSALREVPGMGGKKALEALDKASRSLPEFRRAVAAQDSGALSKVFGFSKKTAEKLAAALKDTVGFPSGTAAVSISLPGGLPPSGPSSRALEALAALGYKPAEAREALDGVRRELSGGDAPVEELVRQALRRL
ncbi:MAG: holliday junction DNA helicase RuvA [Elusimicrobia bacterium]|nr:MAG: holliday junction DNA helicase RuvA [Elusimicrobiota bacterium]